MAKYPNIKLTQKGLDMAINADKSKKLIYTKIGIGDGRLANNEDVLELTAMKSRKIYADISDINNDTQNQVMLETIVSNKVVNEGFYAREIGIYAKLGEDGQEVLYGYANAGDEADYMPDKTQPIDELKLRITLIVGNIDNVTAVINSSIIFITLADCRREIARHNIDPLAHDNLARKDDYYTKPEVDIKLNGKANTAHGNHVPSLESANNSRFLRNDNTWQTITPNNIGAYYKTEVNSRVNAKVSKSGDTMTGTLSFANNIGTCLGGTMADNDGWRIYAGNAGSNIGYLALDTCDDGAEEICVRQFTGNFQNQVRIAQLLRQDGATTFPISVTAPTFYANDWFRAKGNSGFYFQDHGGGWFMQDSDWIRAHGKKNIYTGGRIKADGGFEGTADNAKNFDGRSLSNILGLIDAANTGAVEARLEENGYVKLRNGLIVQWGSIRNYEYNIFPIAHTKWVHVFLTAGISRMTPTDRSTTYGATLVGKPTLTKFYPLVGNTEYEGGVTDKTGVGSWFSIGI